MNKPTNMSESMISIVIPTLNEEKVIGQMIDSIKSRLTLPHELIISDGKSTDRTVEIARKTADKVITYSGEKRQTIAEGRNAGAAAATGEFLVFFDADCTIPDFDVFFTRAIKNFQDPRVVALTAWLTVDPKEETFGDKVVFNIQNGIVYIINNILHGGTAPGGEFQMIRREAFMKIGGFRGQLVASEDIDMFSRLAKVGRVRIDPGLHVYHSGRRGHVEGWPKLLSLWFLNTVWMMTTGRAFVKEWKPIR
jgi:glycosyltransferase involved in cell wall biosynthesis